MPAAMISDRCLYVVIHAPRETHDEILPKLVAPVARAVKDRPQLHSLFFVRYDEPDWQLRVRVPGDPAWLAAAVRGEVEDRLRDLERRGTASAWEYGSYEPETDRYGGSAPLHLCERIFLHDSLACLELLAAERRRPPAASRRE